jgi:hypothetical protein
VGAGYDSWAVDGLAVLHGKEVDGKEISIQEKGAEDGL